MQGKLIKIQNKSGGSRFDQTSRYSIFKLQNLFNN